MNKKISPMTALLVVVLLLGVLAVIAYRATEAPLGGAATGPPGRGAKSSGPPQHTPKPAVEAKALGHKPEAKGGSETK